jgi:hypothetical protein
MPSVSLCMIVRDEEEHIGPCLQAVLPYVDEAIVVDTGSSDRTPDIAVEAGARLFRIKWGENFADARNYALNRASGDWVLVLDADERLEAPDPEAFRQLLLDDTAAGYTLTILQHRSMEPGDYETDMVCRLFRNLPQARYRGRIHEDITIPLTLSCTGRSIKPSGLVLSHFGYLQETAIAKDKARRNRRLLEKAVQEEHDTLYYRYALAVESFLEENYKEAAAGLAPLLSLVPPSAGYAPDLAYKLGYARWRTGSQAESMQAVEKGLAHFPLHTGLRELHAVLLLEEGKPEAALDTMLQNSSSSGSILLEQEARKSCWLGLIHMQLWNWKKAKAFLEKAMQHYPPLRAQALPHWLDLAAVSCSPAHILEELSMPYLEHSEDKALLLAGQYAMKWQLGRSFLPLLEQSSSLSENPELTFIYSVLLAQTGRTTEAAELLEQLNSLAPQKHLILYQWALQNRESKASINHEALLQYREAYPELPVLAAALQDGKSSPELSPNLWTQAAYALLMMEAWSSFLQLWEAYRSQPASGRHPLLTSEWRPALYRAPPPVRKAVLDALTAPDSTNPGGVPINTLAPGDGIFAALLAYSLGDIQESKRLFKTLLDSYPNRLEPRVGLVAVQQSHEEWLPYLFLVQP